MPKTAESAESRMIEACKAAKREGNPNICKIARDYRVSQKTLHNRVKKGIQARTTRNPVNKVLDKDQEESLMRWIGQMNDWNMPLPPRLIEAWANRALAHAGKPD